jgi:FkbM family methyltransferase
MKSLLSKLRTRVRRWGFDIVRHKELPEWLALHGVDVVLDIGANDGRYAREIRESGWKERIVSFEPQPAVFARLMRNMGADPFWSGHELGLGAADETLEMNAYGLDVMSSFLKKTEDDQSVVKIPVSVRRADSIFDMVLGGASRPFVKIDTQGFEMEILRGFGSRINNVIGWQLELSVQPLYDNQPTMEEVMAFMRGHGFTLWRVIPGLRDPATFQAMEFDGIFFRTE